MTIIEEQIKTIIGEELTNLLKEKLGGTLLYIPEKINPKSKLVLAIGSEATSKLCDKLSGQTVYLSSNYVPVKKAIINDLINGASLKECAFRNKVSISYIQKIRSEIRGFYDKKTNN